jgi:hypothetical protein
VEKTMKDKFKEKVHYDTDGRHFTVQRQYDTNPVLEQSKIIRDSGAGVTGENRLVGRIPMFMVTEWMKEAGVALDDTDARKEIIRKKMLSGEFDKFRVWKGTF